MAGATLYARGEESALFLDEPFLPCGDGWRIANPLKRPWAAPPELEQATEAGWEPIEADRVDLVSGAVWPRVPVSRLRGTGRFYPLTLLGEAATWRLEAGFTGGGHSFHGLVGAGQFTGGAVVLGGFEPVSDVDVAGPLYALLDLGETAYACLCARGMGSDSREVRLSVPPAGLALTAH